MLNAIKTTSKLNRLHSMLEDVFTRAFLFRYIGSARWSVILVKVLAALQNGTWCGRTEYVQRRKGTTVKERWRETKKNINNGTLKQEQVLRKAGQWLFKVIANRNGSKFLHGKNNFVERSKILLNAYLKIILLDHQNNFIETLKIIL